MRIPGADLGQSPMQEMEHRMDTNLESTKRVLVSRRSALKGVGAASIASTLAVATHNRSAAQDQTVTSMIEPSAGSWKTWLLASGDQLRPAPPPDGTAIPAEEATVRAAVANRDASALDRISYWDAGPPGYRWNQIATQHTLAAGFGPGDAYRTMALLNAAIYDATIAVWDAKYAYNRARPTLDTAIPVPASPSYPCEHAATAAAASTVLAYLFPDSAQVFAEMASEASDSRLAAGVVYPSDISAGTFIGKAASDLAVARGMEDGSDAPFDPASMRTGPGLWTGEPVYPTLGDWRTWVIPDGMAHRPPAPPAWDSPERQAEVDEIKNYQRDAHPFTELFFWPENPDGRPAPDSGPFTSTQAVFYYAPVLHFVWGEELARKIFEYRLDNNPPRAARAYALVSIAGYDATVANWNAKFHYMVARPDQFDPEITTVLPTYPIPDYPSGHSATLGGTAQMLAYLFPRDANFFQSRADENAASRMWAGIHFRSACEAGVAQGRAVGQAVVDYAVADGAD
jgi:membrane-associated phospholipid phosphatase